MNPESIIGAPPSERVRPVGMVGDALLCEAADGSFAAVLGDLQVAGRATPQQACADLAMVIERRSRVLQGIVGHP